HTPGSAWAAAAVATGTASLLLIVVGMPDNVAGPDGNVRTSPTIDGAADGRLLRSPTAGESVGISRSDGGGIGVDTHPDSAAITSDGVWYRLAGSFAIIFSTTATTSSGTSGRSDLSGRGGRFWCQI